MNDKEFQEIKRQEQKQFEEKRKYDELCNKMNNILCEIGNLAMEVRKLTNTEVKNYLEKCTKLANSITLHSYRYNDEQLTNQIKDFKAEAKTLMIIHDDKILGEKLFDLSYRWKKFLKDTKSIRSKSKKIKNKKS